MSHVSKPTLGFLAIVACTGVVAQTRVAPGNLIARDGAATSFPEWIKQTGMAVTVVADARLRPDGAVSEIKVTQVKVRPAGRPEQVQERAVAELRDAAVLAARTWKLENRSGDLPNAVVITFEFAGGNVSTLFRAASVRR